MSGEYGGLTFETFLADPLIRLVMESDGVTIAEMAAVLEAAGQARARHQEMTERSKVC